MEKNKEKCIYLLRKYPEMKYMEMNTRILSGMGRLTGGSIDDAVRYMEDEQRCIRLAVRRIRKLRKIWEMDLLDNLEAANHKVMMYGKEKEISLLSEAYFSKKGAFDNTKQHCLSLDISRNTFYSVRMEAELTFAGHAEKLFDVDEAFDAVNTEMKRHEPSGIYYRSAEKVLKKYRKLRYAIVNDMIDEIIPCSETDILDSLDDIGNFRRGERIVKWMDSSMMENTFADLLVIEEAVRQMKYFGIEGKESSELLAAVYLDDNRDSYMDNVIEKLGLTQRTFYQRRKKAISMFSKLLLGPLGHRYSFNQLF